MFWGVPSLGLVSGSFRDFLAKLRVGEGLLMRTYSLLSARGFWRVVVLNCHGRTAWRMHRDQERHRPHEKKELVAREL